MLRLITAPTEDLLSLDEAKAHLRVDFNDDDNMIAGMIDAAIIHAQNKVQRRFLTQTLELVLQDWGDGAIKIPVAPVTPAGIVFIKYVDFSNVTQTLDPSAYVVKTMGYSVAIIARYGTIWPIVFPFSSEPIVVRFTAGTAAADVPINVKHAIKMLVAHFYMQREPVLVSDRRAVVLPVPETVDALLMSEAWD